MDGKAGPQSHLYRKIIGLAIPPERPGRPALSYSFSGYVIETVKLTSVPRGTTNLVFSQEEPSTLITKATTPRLKTKAISECRVTTRRNSGVCTAVSLVWKVIPSVKAK